MGDRNPAGAMTQHFSWFWEGGDGGEGDSLSSGAAERGGEQDSKWAYRQ